MQIDVKPTSMPEDANVKPLVGFDCHDGLFHVVLFDFGDGGGNRGAARWRQFLCAHSSGFTCRLLAAGQAQHVSGKA